MTHGSSCWLRIHISSLSLQFQFHSLCFVTRKWYLSSTHFCKNFKEVMSLLTINRVQMVLLTLFS